MTNDDFENQLRRVPMREIPADWRGQILSAAKQPVRMDAPVAKSARQTWWRDLLWPSPLAWAALVLIWFGILLSNVTGASQSSKGRQIASISAEDVILTLARQRSLAGNRNTL